MCISFDGKRRGSAAHELAAARVAQAGGVAGAQAQDLQVVAKFRAGEGQDGGGKEHGLVVRVCD